MISRVYIGAQKLWEKTCEQGMELVTITRNFSLQYDLCREKENREISEGLDGRWNTVHPEVQTKSQLHGLRACENPEKNHVNIGWSRKSNLTSARQKRCWRAIHLAYSALTGGPTTTCGCRSAGQPQNCGATGFFPYFFILFFHSIIFVLYHFVCVYIMDKLYIKFSKQHS